MSSIVTCPACQRQVSLPVGLDPSLSVQCPLCWAEFAVGQVVEPDRSVPPVVIPVVRTRESADAPLLAVPPSMEGVVSAPATSSPARGGDGPANVGPPGPEPAVTAEEPAGCGAAAAAEGVIAAGPAMAKSRVEEELGFAEELPSPAVTAVVSQSIVEVDIPPLADLSPIPPLADLTATAPLAEPSTDAEEDDGGIYRLAGEKPHPAAVESPSDEVSIETAENPCVDIWNDSPSAAPASVATEAGQGGHAAAMGDLGMSGPTPGGGTTTPIPPARAWHPPGKKSNPVRFFIGLVVSGLAGLLAAWFLWSVFLSPRSTQQRPSKTATKEPKGAITPDANDRKKWPGLPNT